MYRLNYFKHAYNGDCKNLKLRKVSLFHYGKKIQTFFENLGTFLPTAKLHILVKTFPKYYFLTFLTNDFRNLNYIKFKKYFSKKGFKIFWNIF